MKVRIIPFSGVYKIQRKLGPLWRDMQRPYEPRGAKLPYLFKQEAEARDWIRERYGASTEIVK